MACSEASVRRLEARNNELLLRLYFKSATTHDASELYTHLALCWLLVPNINEQREAYELLARGVVFLVEYSKTQKLDQEEFDALTDIFKFSLDIVRRSTVDEVVKNADALKSGKMTVAFQFPDEFKDPAEETDVATTSTEACTSEDACKPQV